MNILGLPSQTRLFKSDGFLRGKFEAMRCDCEILMDTGDVGLARELLALASAEAWRIEKKFSRYADGNVIHEINTSGGRPVRVDEETAVLIDFADRCFDLSDGLFDITSGVLRKAWKFDGSDQVPKKEDVDRLLPLVGWKKVKWAKPMIELIPGMEIDLGGIGKEYAVDRVVRLIEERTDTGVLVNFGGDIAAAGRRKSGEPWVVGVEKADRPDTAEKILRLTSGAVATSGDSKKFLMVNGKRFGHILNPRSGWPVAGAPRSVTVAAPTCTEAGFFSTVGMLNGENADSFLNSAGVRHWSSKS